jgi:hypothetical protein
LRPQHRPRRPPWRLQAQPPRAAGEAYNPATDLLDASNTVIDGMLAAVLRVRDLPAELPFDREGVEECSIEYEWGVNIDVDNDTATGNQDGFEYRLAASYISSCESEGILPESAAPGLPGPISVDVWKFIEEGSIRTVHDLSGTTSLEMDPVADTIVLRGRIPAIRADSRLEYIAQDYFAGEDVFTP